jgi:hypothetical protein
MKLGECCNISIHVTHKLTCVFFSISYWVKVVPLKRKSPRCIVIWTRTEPIVYPRDLVKVELKHTTNYMGHNAGEDNTRSASQKIPHLLWNQTVCYRVYKNPSPVNIRSHLNPIHTFQLCLPQTLPSARYLPGGLPSGFPNKFLYAFLMSPTCATCKPISPSLTW